MRVRPFSSNRLQRRNECPRPGSGALERRCILKRLKVLSENPYVLLSLPCPFHPLPGSSRSLQAKPTNEPTNKSSLPPVKIPPPRWAWKLQAPGRGFPGFGFRVDRPGAMHRVFLSVAQDFHRGHERIHDAAGCLRSWRTRGCLPAAWLGKGLRERRVRADLRPEFQDKPSIEGLR